MSYKQLTEHEATFERLGDKTAPMTGLTWRLHAALVYLREAWCVADSHNRPRVEGAIALIYGALNGMGQARLAQLVLIDTLDRELGAKLLNNLGVSVKEG